MQNGSPGTAAVTQPPVVLLVEDDDSNREMYSLFLESSGLWVLGARNGAEGLISARNHHPQVVVTDVGMPVMDGWELAKALRENEQTAQIGIIAVSGRPPEEAAPHVRQHHVDVVLEKPCLPHELLRAVRQLLARGRLVRLRAGQQMARARRLRAKSDDLIERASRHVQRRRK